MQSHLIEGSKLSEDLITVVEKTVLQSVKEIQQKKKTYRFKIMSQLSSNEVKYFFNGAVNVWNSLLSNGVDSMTQFSRCRLDKCFDSVPKMRYYPLSQKKKLQIARRQQQTWYFFSRTSFLFSFFSNFSLYCMYFYCFFFSFLPATTGGDPWVGRSIRLYCPISHTVYYTVKLTTNSLVRNNKSTYICSSFVFFYVTLCSRMMIVFSNPQRVTTLSVTKHLHKLLSFPNTVLNSILTLHLLVYLHSAIMLQTRQINGHYGSICPIISMATVANHTSLV